jgi:hypothetical protein
MDLNQELIRTISKVVELKPILVSEEFSSQRPLKTLGLIKIQGLKFRADKIEKLGLVYIHSPLRIVTFQGGILYPEPSYDLPGLVIDTIKFPKFLFILLDFIIPPLPQTRHQFILDQLNAINERWKNLPRKVLKPLGATIKFRTGLGIFGIFKSRDRNDLLTAVRDYTELWADLYRNSSYLEDSSVRKDFIKYIAEYRRVGKTYSYDLKFFRLLMNQGWAERFLTEISF